MTISNFSKGCFIICSLLVLTLQFFALLFQQGGCDAFMINEGFPQILPGGNFPNQFGLGDSSQWPSFAEAFNASSHEGAVPAGAENPEGNTTEKGYPWRGGADVTKSRRKRAVLAWPANTTFLAQFALTVPLLAPRGVIVPFSLVVPYVFFMPNLTKEFLFTQRSLQERLDIYGFVENLFYRFGFNGHSCLLRAICENGEYHIFGSGIFGEIISLILAVSTTPDSADLRGYLEAEQHGRSSGECWSKYSSCPMSLFNWID